MLLIGTFLVFTFVGTTTSVSATGSLFDVNTDRESRSTSTNETITLISTQKDEIPEEKAEAPRKEEQKEEPKKKAKIHVVKSGENLWAIANQYLGDGASYAEIIEANKDRYPGLVKNPNLIHPGWQLVIPVRGTEEPTATKEDSVVTSEKFETVFGTLTLKKNEELPTVNRDSGIPVEAVKKVKPLTTLDKLNRFNEIYSKAPASVKNRGKLDGKTIDALIKQGHMTDEEWMDLNPPAGFGYGIKDGRISLVNSKNESLSNADLILMTIDEIFNATEEAFESVADTVEDVAYDITDAVEDVAYGVEDVADAVSDAADELRGAIDDVKDAASDTKSSVKESIQRIKDAFKSAKDSIKGNKSDPVKVVKEVDKEADKLFKKSLRNIRMPDFRGVSTSEYSSVLSLTRFLSPKELLEYRSVFTSSLGSKQKTLRSSQETYIKKINKNDTNWIGGNINTAAKNVEKNEEKLRDTWNKFQKVVEIAKKTAGESKKQLRTNERTLRTLNRRLDRIGYSTGNAKEASDLVKEIKALEKENKKLEKDVAAYDDVYAMLRKLR